MGHATIHAHKKVSHKSKSLLSRNTPDANCTTGGLYISPTSGASVNSLQAVDIQWDPTCIDSTNLDIHLLAPWYNGGNTEMTVWSSVQNSLGSKSVTIEPKWWNSTSSIQIQLAIVAAGSSPALTTLPAGPVWTATYTAPADGSTPASASLTNSDSTTGTIGSEGTTKSLSGGKTAAAVIMPLLIVIAGIFLYLRYQRRKSSLKSHRFSQALDKRMSTISTDWKSMSAAGAAAAIRSSMAIGDRTSSAFTFGNIRPSSQFDLNQQEYDEKDVPPIPQMKQVRTGTGVGLRNPAAAAAIAAERASRVSRVSFADTVGTGRPSVDSSRRTRAFHSAYIPPVPALDRDRHDVVSGVPSVYPDSEIEKREDRMGEKGRKSESEEGGSMSPRQTEGPLTLTPEAIRARMQGRGASTTTPAHVEEISEYDEVMPALSLMRTGSLSQHNNTTTTTSHSAPADTTNADDFLFSFPAVPAAAHTASHPSALPSPSLNIATSPISNSPFTLSAYTTPLPMSPMSPMSPSPMSPASEAHIPVMSPDDMLRAYAVRKSTAGAPPPSSFNAGVGAGSGTPKMKGRKLSIRASLGMLKKGSSNGRESPMISSPMPMLTPVTPTVTVTTPAPAEEHHAFGMAGVGARSLGAGAGFAGVGAMGMGMGMGAGPAYAIGEDDEYGHDGEMDYEDAYVGTAN